MAGDAQERQNLRGSLSSVECSYYIRNEGDIGVMLGRSAGESVILPPNDGVHLGCLLGCLMYNGSNGTCLSSAAKV